MDPASAQTNPAAANKQRMDFAPAKESTPPVPVTSAKAAINAMFASRAEQSANAIPQSAREAVNAASESQRTSKSAANLHHGSIQRSMESTRTSASALIKTAGKVDSDSKPVVHTSLKLGADARPKQAPVILPPNARMARVAHSIDRPSTGRMMGNGRRDNQLLPASKVALQPRSQLSPGTNRQAQLPSGTTSSHQSQVTPNSASQASAASLSPSAAGAVAHIQNSALAVTVTTGANQPKRPARRPNRDPQMLSGYNSRRFRAAPKGFAARNSGSVRSAAIAESDYAMTAPPKLREHHATPTPSKSDYGVVQAYHASRIPEPLGDVAPIGRVAESRVASGHGRPAKYEPTIKAENTSNYSFSRNHQKSDEPKLAPYAPGGQSPFLKSVSVEKRPLSGPGAPTMTPASSSAVKPAKASRKNQYSKHTDKADLPSRPTVIIPSSRRSKVPLFFLILLTILLGATVGAAVYLCFFQ